MLLDTIPVLNSLPEREKTEDGYFYPEEYRNKIFRCGNDLIYVKKSVIENLPLMLVNEIINIIINEISNRIDNTIKEMINDKINVLDNITGKIDDIESIKASINLLDDQIQDQAELINNLNNVIEDISEKINEVNKIPDEVDKKLEIVYENYKDTISNIIDEKVLKFESMISSIKRTSEQEESKNKTLSLKELNSLQLMFTADELCKLREKGLI